MVGVITEQDLELADEAFPGIADFFATLNRKPRTFLELVSLFDRWCEPAAPPRPDLGGAMHPRC
jgi:hypothetical protein